MSNEQYKTIESKWLDRRDLFGLKFNNGYVFFEVEDFEDAKYRPHTGLGDLSADSAYSEFKRLEDDRGDDILYVPDEDAFKVIHASVGHRPSFLRRFMNYNDAEIRMGDIPNLGPPTSSDVYGYTDGGDSEYASPSATQEMWIPHNVHPTFNFYNPDDREHAPKISIKMRKYAIRPLDPRQSQDSNAIRRIASPGSPMPLPSAGSLNSQVAYDSTLQNQWGVPAIGLDQARQEGTSR